MPGDVHDFELAINLGYHLLIKKKDCKGSKTMFRHAKGLRFNDSKVATAEITWNERCDENNVYRGERK